jgi:hypothetical protein
MARLNNSTTAPPVIIWAAPAIIPRGSFICWLHTDPKAQDIAATMSSAAPRGLALRSPSKLSTTIPASPISNPAHSSLFGQRLQMPANKTVQSGVVAIMRAARPDDTHCSA